jgi:CDP-diacylglycerol--glycerol-3-phosphate 3-phosphatidyltransferase
MIKKVPNILSTARIIGSLSLILIACGVAYSSVKTAMSVLFIVVYILCGISDILDGIIARRFNAISKIGAKLDTFGDILLFLSAFVSLLFIMKLTLALAPLIWILIAMVSVGFNVVFTKIRFGQFNGVHTILRKIGGASTFFIVPISVLVYEITGKNEISPPAVIAVSVILIVSAIEEFLILLTATEFNPDRLSIFSKKKLSAKETETSDEADSEKPSGDEKEADLNSSGEGGAIDLGEADNIEDAGA